MIYLNRHIHLIVRLFALAVLGGTGCVECPIDLYCSGGTVYATFADYRLMEAYCQQRYANVESFSDIKHGVDYSCKKEGLRFMLSFCTFFENHVEVPSWSVEYCVDDSLLGEVKDLVVRYVPSYVDSIGMRNIVCDFDHLPQLENVRFLRIDSAGGGVPLNSSAFNKLLWHFPNLERLSLDLSVADGDQLDLNCLSRLNKLRYLHVLVQGAILPIDQLAEVLFHCNSTCISVTRHAEGEKSQVCDLDSPSRSTIEHCLENAESLDSFMLLIEQHAERQ